MAIQRDDVHHFSTDDVFDDEYAVDDFDMVADGFAPGRVQDGDTTRWSIHSDDASIRNVNAHMADGSTYTYNPPGPSRNSISKSRDVPNPFTSVEDDDGDSINDGQDSTLERTHSIMSSSTAQYAPGVAHRFSVASSSRNFPSTTNPLHGTSGPSHPYSMYPQGTNLARTPSISTTTSTIRPTDRSVISSQGPTHPYSMYPQNVSDDVVDDDHVGGQTSHAQVHIPVGFPGRNQDFVRRQGPEGEEQDIIGADGHSEQLPPYSEYPEQGVPVTIALSGQVITPQSTGTGTAPSLPSISQQQSAPQSMSDPSSVLSLIAMEQMDSAQSMTSSTNKSWSEKSWKEKRKTRFCGVPFWWILLSLCVVAFIVIVLGASIGGFLSNAKKQAEKHHLHQKASTTSLIDATPIPSASSGSPPPTGVYALSFGAPKATQASCITNTSYSGAWDCNLYGTPQMAIDIAYADGAQSGAEGASLWGGNNASGVNYGTQPPTTHFSDFISVEDNDEPYRGPAFYFQAYYDKFVIVPAGGIPAGAYSSSSSSSKKKRNSNFISSEWQTRRQIVVGDKPWFCFWNQTFLEGFVYANNYTNSSSSSASATTTTTPLSSSVVTSTVVAATGHSTATTSTSQTPSTSASSNQRRDSSSDGGSQYSFADLSSFGYVVKVEERRVPDSPQAYCTQYQILSDGTAGVLSDPNTGKIITVELEETDPSYSAYQSATSVSRTRRRRSDTVSGECHCEWWSGSG